VKRESPGESGSEEEKEKSVKNSNIEAQATLTEGVRANEGGASLNWRKGVLSAQGRGLQ